MSVADAADALGITRQTLHRVVSEKAAISPDMAVRLGKFCGNVPSFGSPCSRPLTCGTPGRGCQSRREDTDAEGRGVIDKSCIIDGCTGYPMFGYQASSKVSMKWACTSLS
jgi:hypothetical protein